MYNVPFFVYSNMYTSNSILFLQPCLMQKREDMKSAQK